MKTGPWDLHRPQTALFDLTPVPSEPITRARCNGSASLTRVVVAARQSSDIDSRGLRPTTLTEDSRRDELDRPRGHSPYRVADKSDRHLSVRDARRRWPASLTADVEQRP